MHEAFSLLWRRGLRLVYRANRAHGSFQTARFKAITNTPARALRTAHRKTSRSTSRRISETSHENEEIEDDRLRLIFTCCHPALPPEGQLSLTLREVCGLTTEEIARAFLITPATLAQRIVRAKTKIREMPIPYEVPTPQELPGATGRRASGHLPRF